MLSSLGHAVGHVKQESLQESDKVKTNILNPNPVSEEPTSVKKKKN